MMERRAAANDAEHVMLPVGAAHEAYVVLADAFGKFHPENM